MKTNKDFDCVKMMRDIRDKIDSDIKNMNAKQLLDYFNNKSIIRNSTNANAIS